MQTAIAYLRVSPQEQGRSGLGLASGFVVSAVRREKKKRRPLDNAAEWSGPSWGRGSGSDLDT
jgi:hypothetical protein